MELASVKCLLYCVFGLGSGPEGGSRPPLYPVEAAENPSCGCTGMGGLRGEVEQEGSAQQHPPPSPVSSVVGVDGKSVRVITGGKLGAACSPLAHFDSLPNPSRLLTYHKVIEWFHRCGTVIPMRYGTLFDGEHRIIEHLEQRGRYYTKLLGELEGQVEMGIRVLISDFKGAASRAAPSSKYTPTSGRSYLSAREAYYARLERLDGEYRDVIGRCRSAFAGLYVKCKAMPPHFSVLPTRPGTPLLSLYFLVPQRSVDPFRQVFFRFSAGESSRLLLSGPWPPYNFVTGKVSN